MPFEPGPHDAQVWTPHETVARVEKDAPAPNIVIDNRSDAPDEELMTYMIENTALFGFGQEARYMSYSAEGTMLARSKWRPPRNVIEEIALARDMVERDDDVAPTVNAMLAAAFHAGYSNQHEDEQVEHTFQEMSEDIGLFSVLHEMYREYLISQQINTVTVFTRATYDIRPENVSRLIRRSVAKPIIGVLPAERIRVLGNDLFGGGQLGYVPDGALLSWLRQYWNESTSAARKREMRMQDPVAAAMFLGKAPIDWHEQDLLSTGMNIYLLNPDMVQRSTAPKGSWRYPRPLLTRNLPLLEAKRLLNVMDHALLQGGINYIVVAKKGDEKKPATNPELANLQGVVQRASRSGVLVGDHRINLEVIQPDLTEMLNPDKRQMIGRKLAQAMMRVPEFGSDDTGAAVEAFTEMAQAVITDDRALVMDHLHRHVWRVCMRRNSATFGRTDRPTVWVPRVILQGLDFWTQYLLKLYDRGDLPRKYVVEFGGYSYDAVKAQKQREVNAGHDNIFTPPAVPFSSPNQGPGDPYEYGNPAQIPPNPTQGPNDNGGGRPRGAGTGSGSNPGRDRPSRVVRRTPGETVRAWWSEELEQVVRSGEITQRVLDEYPDAVLGRVTVAERAALDAGHTTNEGNVIVIPVNPGYQIEDVQAVRLDENFSMLCGRRVPDEAVMAAAFCFREPKVTIHEAEDMVVRWGFPIELRADGYGDIPSDGLTCPSCGATSPMDADACINCGYTEAPFNLPANQRRAFSTQMPLAIHLTVNGDTAKPTQTKPAATKPTDPTTEPEVVMDPGPPPGWASHETELMFRSLMSSKNLWDAALEFASEHRRDAKAIATQLQDKIVPREMLQRLATNGWDPTKIDWLQIAHQLAQRADHPRPKED